VELEEQLQYLIPQVHHQEPLELTLFLIQLHLLVVDKALKDTEEPEDLVAVAEPTVTTVAQEIIHLQLHLKETTEVVVIQITVLTVQQAAEAAAELADLDLLAVQVVLVAAVLEHLIQLRDLQSLMQLEVKEKLMVVDQEQLEQMVKETAEMVQAETAETELLLLED
jgi:hypothetical protein